MKPSTLNKAALGLGMALAFMLAAAAIAEPEELAGGHLDASYLISTRTQIILLGATILGLVFLGFSGLLARENKTQAPSRPKRQKDSNERHRADAAEAVNDLIQTVDTEGRFISVNTAWHRALGYEPDEVHRLSFFDIVHPNRRSEFEDIIRRTAGSKQIGVVETTLRAKDGRSVTVEGNVASGVDHGRTVCFIRFVDVTERRESETQMDRFFALCVDLLSICDFNGRFIRLNPAWERTLGWTAGELQWRPFINFVHPDDRTATLQTMSALVAGTPIRNFENRFQTKDGSYRWLLWNASANLEAGLVYSTAADISDRKLLENELLRKNEQLAAKNREVELANRLKTEFLANMSHELRTPLNAIIGFADLMCSGRVGQLADNHHEFVSDIHTSAKHQLDLINDLLDLSKIEAGKMEFRPETVDLRTIASEVRDVLWGLAQQRNIQISVHIDEQVRNVTVDPSKLKQVLYNFLSNAVKFSQDQGSVELRFMPQDDSHFRMEVEDRGVGIKSEDLGLLFKQFQQLDQATSRRFQGTGLGLALTKRIVEAQNGYVGVKSEYGKGSTFFAVLPNAPKAAKIEPIKPKSILVIENEPQQADSIQAALRQIGYHADAARTGSAGLLKSRQSHYDLVFVDVDLPDVNGWLIAEELNRDKTAGSLVFVAVPEGKPRRSADSIRNVIAKPVCAEELLSKIRRAVH
jgi:PAS domain S-box-containing protein